MNAHRVNSGRRALRQATARSAFRVPSSEFAFTLVELLVVIAIIVALLAILMPSMGKAMEVAKRAKCLSNQHQIHVAAFAAASSQRGVLPTCKQNPGNKWWVQLIMPESQWKLFEQQGVKSENWACPGRERPVSYGADPDFGGALGMQSGYAYLGGIDRWVDHSGVERESRSPRSIATMQSGWALLTDRMHRMNGNWLDPGWGPSNHTLRTNGAPEGGNHLYADGSGKWVALNETRRLQTWWPVIRELYWAQSDLGTFVP